MLNSRLPRPPTSARPLRLGFIALTDAAPLIVAQEMGFFAQQGLRVKLSREVGWATIRDKIIYRELEAAHALAAMLFAMHLGLGCPSCPVLTGHILNMHGNAITLSENLWRLGVRDGATLRAEAARRQGDDRLLFGVVSLFSSHHLLLRHWLLNAGLDPNRDVRIVVVPPAQMFRNLAAGNVDGYCVGEPWNSLAVQEGAGWIPAWSAALQPGHVEKMLLVREDFAGHHGAEHLALIAAIHAACAWCDEPSHRNELAHLLARPEYLNLPVKVISPALLGRINCGHGRIETAPDFHVYHAGGASVPTAARASFIQSDLVAAGLLPAKLASPALARALFREDLHRQAIERPVLSHA